MQIKRGSRGDPGGNSRVSRWWVDDIALPDAARCRGRCWSRLLYTTICGAQINEIGRAGRASTSFLPHLLGHEASA